MAFSNDDILKIAASALAAGTIDSAGSQWYEKRNPWGIIVDPENIWSDLNRLQELPAATFQEAVDNAVANPDLFGLIGIKPDGSFDDDTAIRLTKVAGTNGTTYIAYNNYNVPASGVRKNWIQPQLIPQTSGAASAQYGARIFIGPPSQNKPLTTSAGFDGNWVSHFWSPALGLLMISPNDKPPSATIPTDDLYIVGFTYNGQTGGGGGSFSGNKIILEDPDGTWRIITDGAYLRFERKDFNDDGTFDWNSYGNIGSSLTTDGIILTRPYHISYDLANTLNSDELPDLAQVVSLAGVDQNISIGNSNHLTTINTKRGEDIQRVHTVTDARIITNRPKKDLLITIDRTANPLPDSVPELSWVSNINFSQGSITHIRFNKIGFECDSLDDEINGVPMRLSVETTDGDLIQENVSRQALDANVKNAIRINKGFSFYPISPSYEERQNARTVTRIVVQKGHRVTLFAGEYEYIDPVDGTTKTQIVPYQESEVEYFEYDPIFDASNAQQLTAEYVGTYLDNGVSSLLISPVDGTDQGVWSHTGIGEHVDHRNPVLGNYYDKTYLNAGEGGIWSLVEDKGTRTELWSTNDRNRIFNNKEADQYIETTKISIPLKGVFTKEMEDLETWQAVNLYYIMPLIDYVETDPLVLKNGYRITIDSDVGGFPLQSSQTEFDFLDGKIKGNYFIEPNSSGTPSYLKLSLPRRTFAVNKTTQRTINIYFQKPVRVYGYYENPIDPDNPLPEEHTISVKGEVVRLIEEPIIIGSELEDKLDGVIGEREWKEASEQGLDTLHIVPSLLALADKKGEWLIFSGGGITADNDKHQWIFSTGREAYYAPIASDVTNISGVFTAAPVVIHIPRPTDVNSFGVTLDPALGFGSTSATYIKFVCYVNTYGSANNFKFEINVPKNASIYYQFHKRRDGTYSYRGTPYNDRLASVRPANDSSLNIPVDPKPPIKI